MPAVLVSAKIKDVVISILIPMPEPLTEIVAIFVQIHPIAGVAVSGILIRATVFIAESPAVFIVRPSGIVSLFITVIDGILQHLRHITVDVEIFVAAIIAESGRRVEKGIVA